MNMVVEVDKNHDKIMEIKKFIIKQLTASVDADMEYKLSLDYINNYKNDNYREMIIRRTNKTAIDLYKETTTFVCRINKWIYECLQQMSDTERARLFVDSSYLKKFLDKVHTKIKEDHHDAIFVSRT